MKKPRNTDNIDGSGKAHTPDIISDIYETPGGREGNAAEGDASKRKKRKKPVVHDTAGDAPEEMKNETAEETAKEAAEGTAANVPGKSKTSILFEASFSAAKRFTGLFAAFWKRIFVGKPSPKDTAGADTASSIIPDDYLKSGPEGVSGLEETPKKSRQKKTPSPEPETAAGGAAAEAAAEADTSSGAADKTASKKPWSLRKKLIVGVSCALAACVLGAGIWFLAIYMDPLRGFDTMALQFSAEPSSSETAKSPDVTDINAEPAEETPDATVDPYEELSKQADFSILENTVNILLIGVDYSPERDDWRGKHTYHSDVMIVLSINKETGQVSMISLPRDSYAQIPADPDGIYKLNASLNCGGEWPEPAACEEVCRAASWMIGGLPVKYYYAVDMTAVKDLVDKIGGVYFNVDIAFKMAGRKYEAGWQQMDGQAALDYMRVRKDKDIYGNDDSEEGDKARVNRQKNMLVAIFEKIKNSGYLTQIHNIISAFDSNHLVTNVPADMTLGLALYSRTINGSDIKMYSMSGSYIGRVFGDPSGLAFAFTNQSKRREIIWQVYGVDIVKQKDVIKEKFGVTVPSYSDYSLASAKRLGAKMKRYVTLNHAEKLLNKMKAKLDADAKLPPEPSPTATASSGTESNGVSASSAYRKYPSDGREWTLYNKCVEEYNRLDSVGKSADPDVIEDLLASIHSDIKKLGGYLSIKVSDSTWYVIYNSWWGKFNQPYVHDKIKVDPR